MLGLTKVLSLGTVVTKVPSEVGYRFLRQAKIGVCKDAPLSRDFKSGNKEIIPIIFSHGCGGSVQFHTRTCKDLAGHGYMVFAINHNDFSCTFTYDKEGRPIFYDNIPKLHDLKFR